jgi:hypothetical protein
LDQTFAKWIAFPRHGGCVAQCRLEPIGRIARKPAAPSREESSRAKRLKERQESVRHESVETRASNCTTDYSGGNLFANRGQA